MSSSLMWVKDPVEAWMPGYRLWVDVTLPQAVEAVLVARMDEITEWMKANAVWKDRTGNARRSLHTEVIKEGFTISLVMQYTIPIFYSRYLETMQAGRFSILSPALDFWAPILLSDLKKALGK